MDASDLRICIHGRIYIWGQYIFSKLKENKSVAKSISFTFIIQTCLSNIGIKLTKKIETSLQKISV